MGTMCNQKERPQRTINAVQVECFVDEINEIAKKKKISYELALKTYELAAYERRTDIMIDNGDFTDENMCGIGTAIKEVAERLSDVASALEEIARNSHE